MKLYIPMTKMLAHAIQILFVPATTVLIPAQEISGYCTRRDLELRLLRGLPVDTTRKEKIYDSFNWISMETRAVLEQVKCSSGMLAQNSLWMIVVDARVLRIYTCS